MNKTGSKIFLRFFLFLSLMLLVSFFLHAYLQHISGVGFFEKQIITTYLFNYVLTLATFLGLLYFKERRAGQLGFIFLFSSLLKFTLFFVFINPGFKGGVGVKSPEFTSFFVPYALGLFMEIFQIVRFLNKE